MPSRCGVWLWLPGLPSCGRVLTDTWRCFMLLCRGDAVGEREDRSVKTTERTGRVEREKDMLRAQRGLRVSVIWGGREGATGG